MWMMPLHLQVNQKSDYDDDEDTIYKRMAGIHQLFQERAYTKHNFGQTLKLQSAVVTLNIKSRSQKSR